MKTTHYKTAVLLSIAMLPGRVFANGYCGTTLTCECSNALGKRAVPDAPKDKVTVDDEKCCLSICGPVPTFTPVKVADKTNPPKEEPKPKIGGATIGPTAITKGDAGDFETLRKDPKLDFRAFDKAHPLNTIDHPMLPSAMKQ